jgi:hypothetical protein
MTARGALLALFLTSSCVIPAVASAAIVQKWQTANGVTYKVLAWPGYLFDDGSYNMITAELVSGTQRIGLRDGATGALLAQTEPNSYAPYVFWFLDMDGDSRPEIIFLDGAGAMVCLTYIPSSSTLAVLWSVALGQTVQPLEWVDFDGNGFRYLVAFVTSPGPYPNGQYLVYDYNGVQVAAPALPSTNQTISLYVNDFDSDGRQELLVAYDAEPNDLYMLEINNSVGIEPGIHVPLSLELGAAYPNPAFTLSHIDFSMPTAGQVSLRLFDVAGREVRTLVEGQVTAGSHKVTWDGRDANGRQVPTGAYFFELNAGGQHASKRMVRMR